jgi:hypothetical protein
MQRKCLLTDCNISCTTRANVGNFRNYGLSTGDYNLVSDAAYVNHKREHTNDRLGNLNRANEAVIPKARCREGQVRICGRAIQRVDVRREPQADKKISREPLGK